MDDNKRVAIDLAKSLIQNNNVKPVFNRGNDRDDSGNIGYVLGDTKYSFSEIVSYFLDNIDIIDKDWL
ncbi:hypothetical protein NC661_06460 [Aquibacillus koreensis]|uniref:Uncharacterized protein n=1 Tax=Aquibacillus koreensis TaxID=279446 RepID=A0A9X4AHS6_9BACI|nr:hypothetical protein [Aquibacillus koreensis]MCT2535706.1 hypothetical protein [Aquibacillus koreensis]MDC3420009.1 hypothetical protein [Aquibacillus koreensis]